mgnify:CR=1 FL=1
MKQLGSYLALMVLCCWSSWVLSAPTDFNSAKKVAQRIYSDEAETFYCGCPLRWQGGKGIADLKACGYQVRKNGPRANRIEWEHVVPAHRFGKSLRCWQQGGREQCGDTDGLFRQMEADLFNLKPTIGEVNGDRANFAFALLPHTPLRHGACPIRIDFARKLAEPRVNIRGDIARIYFYMADKYGLTLSTQEQKLKLSWHQADPVDARELQLQQRIAQQMGHSNAFVTGQKEWFLGYQPSRFGLATGAGGDGSFRDGRMSNPSANNTAPSNTDPNQTRLNNPSSNVTSQPNQQNMQNQVLGNKNSQLYHLSHCPGFSQVKASNQRWFDNEAQAQQAGFRRAKNCL